MATTTAEMQDLQEVNRGSDKDLTTQGPSEQGGALGLTKGGALPSLNEILAQPAVKKATPGIMIAILSIRGPRNNVALINQSGNTGFILIVLGGAVDFNFIAYRRQTTGRNSNIVDAK